MVPVDCFFFPHFKSSTAEVNSVKSPTCMGGFNPLAFAWHERLLTQNSDSLQLESGFL